MLVDFEYTMGKLYVSYIGGDGRLKMKQYPWKDPAQFEVASPGEKGEPGFQTWDGKPVVKRSVRTPNRYAVADFMDSVAGVAGAIPILQPLTRAIQAVSGVVTKVIDAAGWLPDSWNPLTNQVGGGPWPPLPYGLTPATA